MVEDAIGLVMEETVMVIKSTQRVNLKNFQIVLETVICK